VADHRRWQTIDSGKPSTVADHRQWRATMVRESTVINSGCGLCKFFSEILGFRQWAATAAATAAVARFKRYEILTHYFSTLDGIRWTKF